MQGEEKKRANGVPQVDVVPAKKAKVKLENEGDEAKITQTLSEATTNHVQTQPGAAVSVKQESTVTLACDESIRTPICEAMQYNVMPSTSLEQNATSPNYTILVMFTDKARVNDDQMACGINFVYLGHAEPGFTKAPYEPDINAKSDIKHKIFVKDGKPTVPLTTLNQVARDEETKSMVLKCYSYEKHPSAYFATRGRGKGTEKPVGYLKPGIQLQCMLFVDGADTKFADEEDKKRISAFSLGHIRVTVRKLDWCMPAQDGADSGGYGLQVKKVLRVFEDAPAASLFNTKYFLHDARPIDEQMREKLEENTYPDKLWPDTADLCFVRKMVANEKYAKPPVVIDLRTLAETQPDRVITANVEANADGKSLELVLKDKKSVFDNKCLKVHVSKNMFPNAKVDIMWARDIFQYAIDSKNCIILVQHNARALGTDNPLDCMILVYEHELFSRGVSPRNIELSADIMNQFCDEDVCAYQKRDVMHLGAKHEDGKPIFSVWCNNAKQNKLTGSGVEFMTVLKSKPLKKRGTVSSDGASSDLSRSSSFLFSLVDTNSIPNSDFYVCYFCEFHDGKLRRVIVSGLLKPVASLVQLPALVRANTVGLLDQFESA